MTGKRFTGLAPAVLLVASFLPVITAQTATLDIPTGLPASCTPLATLLSEYPPPTDGEVVDDALNEGLETFYSRYEATATVSTFSLDYVSLCDFIISTQIPSATPSATPALSSYISAAGIWLKDHGLEEATSLLDGDCDRVVQSDDELARGALDFVVAFGPCYKLLGWDQRTLASSSATTTDASSAPTTTPTGTSSGSRSLEATPSTTQSSETDASPPNAGSRKMADAFWIVGMAACVIVLLS
ncbi:hypothetical protein GQX73_g6725 [Xylaria multiplex]|uniref:Uncharacterized protein n=1 Tax=Xylaria multiplex TaxID=323545 RepID=A0A7C8MMU7_9PEZI|nr:hypothetical protein GQX73_g6725 [Xylaria multiplex]